MTESANPVDDSLDAPDINCVICGNQILACPVTGWNQGNNAIPVAEGRCCDACDSVLVLPRRLKNALDGKDPYEGRGLW